MNTDITEKTIATYRLREDVKLYVVVIVVLIIIIIIVVVVVIDVVGIVVVVMIVVVNIINQTAIHIHPDSSITKSSNRCR